MGRDYRGVWRNRDELYREAVAEFGPALDRVAAAYEADRERRSDLRQEIHFQLWRSFERFDGRCSARTWAFRVAHNVAISHVNRERRRNTRLVSLEEVQQPAAAPVSEPDMDRDRALTELRRLILQLKPLDRQIVTLYLEEMDAASIAEVTGLSAANVAMKVSRIKNILAERFAQERRHAG